MQKIKLILAVAFAAVVGLTSCLKEDTPLSKKESNNVVEIYNEVPALIVSSIESTYPLYVNTFEIEPSVDFEVYVNYAGSGVAPQDITVNLDLNPDAIDYYNAEFGTHYIVLPTDKYTVDTWTLTIPKGQRKAKQTFKLKTDMFDFAEAYTLPVRIKTVSSGIISNNYGTVIFSVGAKNQYDGIYQYTTSANTSLLPNRSVEVGLITLSATKVGLDPGLLGYYGNVVNYMINPANNAVTVECPSLGVQTPQDTRSNYDPATKTFKVFWKQGNGGRTFEETLVYKRPR